jgi:hypothetical protein
MWSLHLNKTELSMKVPPEQTDPIDVADGKKGRVGTDGFSTADILDKKLANSLYPVALRSLNQSILFYAETFYIQDELLMTMAVDHTLFHLAVFMLFITPYSLPEDEKYRMIRELTRINRDPGPFINQMSFEHFIQKFEEDSLPDFMIDFISKWKPVREFVNFGFPIRFTPGGISVDDCAELREQVAAIKESLGDIFIFALKSACYSCGDEGRMVLNALGQVKKFFTDPDHFYSVFCSANVLEKAEDLRRNFFYSVKTET